MINRTVLRFLRTLGIVRCAECKYFSHNITYILEQKNPPCKILQCHDNLVAVDMDAFKVCCRFEKKGKRKRQYQDERTTQSLV